MKENIMKLWVKALRSGKYKQGTGRLKTLNGIPRFCCLGVLCDLHSKATGKKWKDKELAKEGKYAGKTGLLPAMVMGWAGLKSNDPMLTEKMNQHAAGLNDNGNRFKTIANLIEKAQKQKLI